MTSSPFFRVNREKETEIPVSSRADEAPRPAKKKSQTQALPRLFNIVDRPAVGRIFKIAQKKTEIQFRAAVEKCGRII
jgi:hypothetical protein